MTHAPSPHTFHIPVMGTGFSIDTPLKVAPLGISSVVSLGDDTLIEQIRAHYCRLFNEPYDPITPYQDDHRARRITAYLNALQRWVSVRFEAIRREPFEPGTQISQYFEWLPDGSELKQLYQRMLAETSWRIKKKCQEELRALMRPGSIDVNIMTKLDRANFRKTDKKPLPAEFSDALSALRGFAKSRLEGAVVFSAGINQRLFSYVEQFRDFFVDRQGMIKKRIIIKVSDFRSSLIQGKFFAKKGIWVSEYRIESGLNCGGHAFATLGQLMGPILEEFKQRRRELAETLHGIFNAVCRNRLGYSFDNPLPFRVTAQGGIGTAKEDTFLREYYGLDGTGWGTPFLLCPEATNVDDETLKRLAQAEEKDLYLSDVSPLGVPFNNLRQSLSDEEKMRRFVIGRPGSSCPKGHLVSNTEFTERPICTASRQFQHLKIEQLKKSGLPQEELDKRIRQVVQKACICHDLGEGVLIKYNIPSKTPRFPAVCPGPNLAYFNRIVSLKEMVDHIYGRADILNPNKKRPHMFLKELRCYVDYLWKEFEKAREAWSPKKEVYFKTFGENLLAGVDYYRDLFSRTWPADTEERTDLLAQLDEMAREIRDFLSGHRQAGAPLSPAVV